ncbi:MAG: hypothetical protein R3F20_00330 [Planctomycetota bacterium]
MMSHLRIPALLLLLVGALSAQNPVEVVDLPGNAPLSLAAVGTPESLRLDLVVNPDWHLYARDVGGGVPVSITLREESDYRAKGPIILPTSADGTLTGSFSISVPLERVGKGTRLEASFAFMACDPLACLPPMSVTLRGDLAPRRVLLVVGAIEAREKGMADFLRSRGFVCDLTTYGDVTPAACEAHDVVLADSRLFGQLKTKIATAKALPRTATPIVAVGFLGTELIEAHGLAMTSGYI